MKKEKFQEEVMPSSVLDMDNVDADGQQCRSVLDAHGRFEYPDPVPMAPPVGYNSPPDIMQMIRSMVRSERLAQELDAAGYETFEEADDFDIADDPLDPLTPYEKVFEAPPVGMAPAGANGGGAAQLTPAAAPVQASSSPVSPVPGNTSPSGSDSSGSEKSGPGAVGSP